MSYYHYFSENYNLTSHFMRMLIDILDGNHQNDAAKKKGNFI